MVIRTLRFHTFHKFGPPLEIESFATRFIPSGDEPYYKGRAVRQKGLNAALLGAFDQKAIDSLSPGVDSGFGIEETARTLESKEVLTHPSFCPCRPQLTTKARDLPARDGTGVEAGLNCVYKEHPWAT